MGIREVFARISKKRKEEKEELAKMLREKRMEKISDDRMKSPNERELEKFIEERRQKRIKEQLSQYRNQHQKGWWSGEDSILKQRNMFKEDQKSQILKQRNIFAGKNSKNKMMSKGVYFK